MSDPGVPPDDEIIEAESLDDDGDGDVYDDGVIEPAADDDRDDEIEDADVVGESGLLDQHVMAMLRDTTGETPVNPVTPFTTAAAPDAEPDDAEAPSGADVEPAVEHVAESDAEPVVESGHPNAAPGATAAADPEPEPQPQPE